MDIKKDFIQRLRGRAEFCRDRGEVKTPELLEQAAQLLEEKAQAVPENKIEFDGEYIKYPNSYAIHCQFDEDFDCHIFDVYQNEDCVKDGMTQLKQAHLFVFSMSEAQEPTND